jgi:diketogulonate reductase-like aldo/keto reductase
VQINGGAGKVAMPLVGMGTWTDTETVAEDSVKLAFAAGYRHVDTAFDYENQDAVGRALKASKVARNEYFVTSKVPPGNATATAAYLETCLEQLGLEYVDLMLIHYNDPSISSPQQRKEQWLEMEKWAKSGKARAIGVSHFCKTHIEDILEVATVPIAVDQVQYHVGMGMSGPNANDDKAFIQSKGILYESFSPLCGPCTPPDNRALITGKLVTDIGGAHNKSGVQVALKWLVQQGIPVIPRSDKLEHIKENIDLFDFELSAEEMKQLSSATSPAVGGGPGPQDSGDCSIRQELVV